MTMMRQENRIETKEKSIKTLSAQLTKLSSIIAEADQETKSQAKQYDELVNEQVFNIFVDMFLSSSPSLLSLSLAANVKSAAHQ